MADDDAPPPTDPASTIDAVADGATQPAEPTEEPTTAPQPSPTNPRSQIGVSQSRSGPYRS